MWTLVSSVNFIQSLPVWFLLYTVLHLLFSFAFVPEWILRVVTLYSCIKFIVFHCMNTYYQIDIGRNTLEQTFLYSAWKNKQIYLFEEFNTHASYWSTAARGKGYIASDTHMICIWCWFWRHFNLIWGASSQGML